MAGMLETPSRVWRRIEAVEGKDMPSLPSLPAFDDSHEASDSETGTESNDEGGDILPVHSTPAVSFHTQTTIRPPSSTSSTARFAHSIASRSSKSALSASAASVPRLPPDDSFDISSIPSLPNVHGDDIDLRSSDQETEESSLPASPPLNASASRELDRELDISEALRSISRPNSPDDMNAPTPQRKYDYSVSLRSEKKASPFDKMRNISLRRPLARTRTPSLTRTTPSPTSSSSHSTPHSNHSINYTRAMTSSPSPAAVPLPRSATASPALAVPLPPSLNVSPAGDDPGVSYATEIHDPLSEPEGGDMDLTDTLSQQLEEHDPTFSSETSSHGENERGRQGLSVAFSSPMPSAMYTPTPAYQPRPQARFPLATPRPLQQRIEEEETGNLATPSARKRSFLLSVINSTARPRISYTPHPHRGAPATPGVNLRAAFAGVTPRAQPLTQSRPRLSRPLAPLPESTPERELQPASEPESPYDPVTTSFVSTASSHDLTAHARANASFDPVMGLGERGHGVGRFNAGKLNAYLHGLNRRLQEENETLVVRLRTYEEKYGQGQAAGAGATEGTGGTPQADQSRSSRRSSAGRRVSMGPSLGLGDVPEEVAEGWLEEKAELQETVEELKEGLERAAAAKEAAEHALQQEKSERGRDKERWRERMTEVERGVSGIVQDLEEKLAEAEKRAKAVEHVNSSTVVALERRLGDALSGKEVLEARMRKAEQTLESGRELGAELNATNERVSLLTADLRNANQQVKELEVELMTADGKIDDLEKKLQKERDAKNSAEEDLRKMTRELEDAFNHMDQLTQDLHKTQQDLCEAEAYAVQLDTDAGAAVERIEGLENRLSAAQERMAAMEQDAEQDEQEINRLSDGAKQAAELGRQMQQALEAAETRIVTEEQEVASLKATLASMERAAEREKDLSRFKTGHSLQSDSSQELRADVEALEEELATAHKEIARLRTLISQSPARKAVGKAKDAKIELLEKEKADLLERLKTSKGTASLFATPNKGANISGLSPAQRHLLSLSMRSPKTPGGPLGDLSWLQATINDPSVSPLVAEIARLQQELDRANHSIDDKLDKLEDAGLGVVGLTRQLEDTRERVIALEDELSRLSRREERVQRRLQKVRCLKCRTKVDLRGLVASASADESTIMEDSHMSLASEPPTPPTKTSEALRAQLQQVNNQLASMKQAWNDEKHKLLGEKAVLQDAANRLSTEVRDAKKEVKRLADTEKVGQETHTGIQEELARAKRAIDELENELTSERARLRGLSAEQTRVQKERDRVALELHRTESDIYIAGVRDQLQRLKQENQDLSAQLKANAVAERKARLLENQVSENAEIIEQLRQERSLLAAEHKELQQSYSKISEYMNQVREEHAASQQSHDERRHQLDLRLLEIDDLRRALSEQAAELLHAQSERNRLSAEKDDVARSVAVIEADLQRVRRDAEVFGRDLKLLRAQKDRLEEERKLEQAKAERSHKQAQSQIRVLKEELEGQKQKARAADEQLRDHVCVVDEQQLADLKAQHKQECKGLIIQIRYLKAKFTRESALRCDLGYQKQYLLVLLAHYERTEQRILAAIARIGFPAVDPPKASKKRTLKSVALSIVFIGRSRRAADSWREHRSSKDAIDAALQEVRRRRADGGDVRATVS